ncbi:ATP-grasp domain-containing protein [Aureivirga marina]|uniref:D-alanine--D-alanine ligase n=1 Tax=Aureivirga marina TaxID=1182451 RepID=UPI0018CA61F2|nr:D-alanine--D-alanine ligase [Aureivirga marina]
MKKVSNFKKIFQWEYWPSYMFYVPIIPYAVYLALKSRNFVFFSATNPAIKHSGNGAESKYKTIQLIPEEFRPKTILVKKKHTFKETLKQLEEAGINFPLIAKPDIGFRGLLVKKIDTPEVLKTYLKQYKIPIIIQEFVAHPNECGIFYYRIPGEKKGQISSITIKKYLTVLGNGKNTLEELIVNDERAQFYLELMREIHGEDLKIIPKKEESVLLNVIGNHAKGTQFFDGNHLIDEKLIASFDSLNEQINGWYYGRLDIKYDNFEDLKKGKNFKILEINGIIAEPTHIYDATNQSYLNSLKTITEHWKVIQQIATKNHENHGIPYAKASNFIKDIKELLAYTKKIKELTNS